MEILLSGWNDILEGSSCIYCERGAQIWVRGLDGLERGKVKYWGESVLEMGESILTSTRIPNSTKMGFQLLRQWLLGKTIIPNFYSFKSSIGLCIYSRLKYMSFVIYIGTSDPPPKKLVFWFFRLFCENGREIVKWSFGNSDLVLVMKAFSLLGTRI